MGLPAHGDIIVSNNGVPSIRTEFGTFPLSDTSLMSIEERINLLPIVRQFTDILERGSADPVETELLLEKAQSLTRFIHHVPNVQCYQDKEPKAASGGVI